MVLEKPALPSYGGNGFQPNADFTDNLASEATMNKSA
jgi:hypothetical protein